jgi:flagellar motor protein MotB
MQDTATQAVYRRRWFFVTVIVLLLGVIILTTLPFGLSYAVNNWLRQNGGEQVTIRDVDFNLFTGRASIEDLRLSSGQRELMAIPRLDLDLDWLPLFSRQVVVRSVLIHGVALEVEQAADGSLRIGGINLADDGTTEDTKSGNTWHLGVDALVITDTSVNYRTPKLQLDTRLDDLRLSAIKTWVDQPASVTLRGSINGAPINFEGELPPLSRGAGYRGHISIDGLDLAGFAGIAGEFVNDLEGRLDVSSKVDILQPQDAPLVLSQSGTVAVSALSFTEPDTRVALGRLAWDGEIGLDGGESLNVNATGNVQGAGMNLDIGGRQLAVGEVNWAGRLELASTDTVQLTCSVKGSATRLEFDIQGSAARLAQIDAVNIDNFVLHESGDIDITALTVDAIALAKMADGEEAGAIVSIGGLALDSARLAGGDVALGRLSVSDLVADLQRDSDGQWRMVQVIDSLQSPQEPVEPGSTETTAEAQGPAISIDAITITGDSAVSMNDASVQPAFTTRLAISAAEIGRIDSAAPAADTPLTLAARTGKHSKIEIKGTLRPFAERLTLDLDSHLEGIALTEVSPYTISTLGYALKSGHLDADSAIGVDQGKLDIGNKLTIRGLEVSAVENASREKLDQQMAVPLDTALNMLRDKHDTIKLDLPVSGDIDSPDFDISDAVNTAVSKALKKGARTYLLLALQPYGALISVAQIAGEAASSVRLDPVVFAAGGKDVPADTHDYLEKVAGILTDRPELNIKICGHAGEQDRLAIGGPVGAPPTAGGRLPDTVLEPGLAQSPQAGATPPPAAVVTDAQLLELAEQRAVAVTDFLVTRYGVTASRLVTCQPSIDSKAEAQGRVDLLI